MGSFLTSGLVIDGWHPTLAFEGRDAVAPSLGPREYPAEPAGHVLEEVVGAAEGVFGGRILAHREAVVLVKTSFDPRWRGSVDGIEVTPQLVAPGFVGVPVPPGRHEVLLTYASYPAYGPLLALGVVSLMGIHVLQRLWLPRKEDPTGG
jgi:hypothetical protein